MRERPYSREICINSSAGPNGLLRYDKNAETYPKMKNLRMRLEPDFMEGGGKRKDKEYKKIMKRRK